MTGPARAVRQTPVLGIKSFWAKIADELDLLTLSTSTGPGGTCRQAAELTKTQRGLPAKLKVAHPRKLIEATRKPLSSSGTIG